MLCLKFEKKIKLIFLIIFYCLPAFSFADTIILKDGDIIETNYCWNEDYDAVGYYCESGICLIKKSKINFDRSTFNSPILPNDGTGKNLPPPIKESISTYSYESHSINHIPPSNEEEIDSQQSNTKNMPISEDIEQNNKKNSPKPIYYSIRGDLTLIDSDIARGNGFSCYGTGGYSDISGNMQVTVRDGNGNILAVGHTEPGKRPVGKYSEVTCIFSFKIDKVPRSDFYSIQIGRRGELNYSFEEMQKLNWVVHFHLG